MTEDFESRIRRLEAWEKEARGLPDQVRSLNGLARVLERRLAKLEAVHVEEALHEADAARKRIRARLEKLEAAFADAIEKPTQPSSDAKDWRDMQAVSAQSVTKDLGESGYTENDGEPVSSGEHVLRMPDEKMPPVSVPRRCETCRWRKQDGGRSYGWCHRHPPQVDVDSEGVFPSVNPDDFCGEWEGRGE